MEGVSGSRSERRRLWVKLPHRVARMQPACPSMPMRTRTTAVPFLFDVTRAVSVQDGWRHLSEFTSGRQHPWREPSPRSPEGRLLS